MKKRIIAIVLLLGVAAAGAYAAYWYRDQTETKVKRGSSTIEFVTTEAPGTVTRPPREVKQIPWPRYAYDVERTHFAADFRHRPPFRTLWRVETGDYIEFPPAVADNRVFVANQHGDFLAIWAKSGRVAWRKDFDACIASGPGGRERHRLPLGDDPESVRPRRIGRSSRAS